MLVIFLLHKMGELPQQGFCIDSFDQVTSSIWARFLQILGRIIQTVSSLRNNNNIILQIRQNVTERI